MKVVYDTEEVRAILTRYAANTQHLSVNSARIEADGTATLWWQEPPPRPRDRRSALGWAGDAIVAPFRWIAGKPAR